MNEFTKEELETILDAIHYAENDVCNRSCEPWDAELSGKLQSMIDSYCEHEPEGDWHVCVDKCTKCGVICE